MISSLSLIWFRKQFSIVDSIILLIYYSISSLSLSLYLDSYSISFKNFFCVLVFYNRSFSKIYLIRTSDCQSVVYIFHKSILSQINRYFYRNHIDKIEHLKKMIIKNNRYLFGCNCRIMRLE